LSCCKVVAQVGCVVDLKRLPLGNDALLKHGNIEHFNIVQVLLGGVIDAAKHIDLARVEGAGGVVMTWLLHSGKVRPLVHHLVVDLAHVACFIDSRACHHDKLVVNRTS